MTPAPLTIAATPSSGPNAELATNVDRFEHLVAEHSDYLRRIELLLDEIELNCQSSSRQ